MLPAPLLDAIRRLAVFGNPVFSERQAMRLSTGLTPRVIACFEDLVHPLALPRGCLNDLNVLLEDLGIGLLLTDERSEGTALDAAFTGTLTVPQARAVAELAAEDIGVLCAPPGAGKTVMGVKLIALRGRSTLILVHRKPLVEQWAARLREFLDVDPRSIGTVGGGRSKPSGVIDVARRDGHQPIIAMQCGPTRHVTSSSPSGPGALRVVRRETGFDPSGLPPDPGIQEVYSALVADPERLELVAADTLALLAEGRAPIVLTERRDHLDRLVVRLSEHVPGLVTLHGDVTPRRRRDALARLSRLSADEPRLILATGRFIGEGFDDPRLDTLLLAMPIAWKGTVVQYAGRSTVHIPQSPTCASTTTSTSTFPSCDACSQSAPRPTER